MPGLELFYISHFADFSNILERSMSSFLFYKGEKRDPDMSRPCLPHHRPRQSPGRERRASDLAVTASDQDRIASVTAFYFLFIYVPLLQTLEALSALDLSSPSTVSGHSLSSSDLLQ